MKYPLIIILSLFVNTLLSQVNWGFRVGNSINTFRNGVFTSYLNPTRGEPSPKSEIGSIVGIDLSVFIKYHLTPRFSIQPEFHFLNKGGEVLHHTISDIGWVNGLSTLYKLDVLEMPIILKYHLGKKKSFVPLLGASFGYRIGRRLSGNIFCYNDDTSSLSICAKSSGKKRGWKELQRLDVSGVLGFSYEERLLGQMFIFDIRFLYDFTDDKSNLGIKNLTLRHRNLLMTVGMEF